MNKRLLLSVTLLLGILLGGYAQEMKVTSFKRLDNDLTAKRQGTSRVDFNGRTAALIRVITPGKGYAFDGGSLGIVGNVEYHSGEIWVYVPERAQKISISHTSYGVLRDYYYTEDNNNDEIKANGWSLVPSRYIEFVDRDTNIDYENVMSEASKTVASLLARQEANDAALRKAFATLGFKLETKVK